MWRRPARTDFKHMDFFYLHNCLYESAWKDNRRRHNEKSPTCVFDTRIGIHKREGLAGRRLLPQRPSEIGA